MIIETLHIFPQDENAYLTTYIRDNPTEMNNSPRDAILICPGGAYQWCSPREAEPVAMKFLGAGFNVFVLEYSTADKASNLVPLCEAVLAIKHIRENAERYNINPNRVFILGFSAGGHLACSTGTLYQNPKVAEALGVEAGNNIGKPNGLILCYPVITATCPTHELSMQSFCGEEEPSPENLFNFCLDLHVDSTTPPTFIWHTFSDESVPVYNSLNFVKALKDNNVPFEFHVFPEGPHGLSLGTNETCQYLAKGEQLAASKWVDLAIEWVKNLKI